MNPIIGRYAVLWLTGLLASSTSLVPSDDCATVGCFEASATGYVQQSITGQASYGFRDSRLLIVLAGNDAARITLVFTRDSAGVPAHGQDNTLAVTSCEENGDIVPAAKRDQFHVSVRGGNPVAPVWLATANSGSLQLTMNNDGVLVGSFNIAACGLDVATAASLRITLSGSFQAERMK